MPFKKLIFFLLLTTIYCGGLAAQDKEKKIIQMSGLVVAGDSLYGIPGVTVFVPNTSRGATTNSVGYFSMVVLAGDSVSFRTLGFKKRWYVVPDSASNISVVVELEEDTLILPEVVLWPYPTETDFKDAFLALDMGSAHEDNMNNNLNPRVLEMMLIHSDASASMNHKYFMHNQITRIENRRFLPTISLLNPFAWAKFIDQVKGGGLKNKEWEEAERKKREDKD